MIPSTIKRTTVLAIDPGYDRLGWAVGEQQSSQLSVTQYGLIQTLKSESLADRYSSIQTQLEQIIIKYRPSQLAIESLFFFKNKSTALQVSEARGVVIGSCLKHGLKIYEYTPPQIKQAVTGYGQADKAAVAKMVELELKIKTVRMVDDVADALAILITHRALVNSPFLA